MEKPDPKVYAIEDPACPPPGEDLTPKVLAEAAAPTSGVQEPPVPSLLEQQGNAPIQIEETDFLRYQLLGSKIEKAQILINMYQRELQRAQIQLAEEAHAANVHVKFLEEKYKVDLRLNQVSADGYFIPRAAEQAARMQQGSLPLR